MRYHGPQALSCDSRRKLSIPTHSVASPPFLTFALLSYIPFFTCPFHFILSLGLYTVDHIFIPRRLPFGREKKSKSSVDGLLSGNLVGCLALEQLASAQLDVPHARLVPRPRLT